MDSDLSVGWAAGSVGTMMRGDERALGRTRTRLAVLVGVLLMAVAGLMCVVTAPFFAPDEENQSMRAITLGHGQVVEQQGSDDAEGDVGGILDTNAFRVMRQVDALRMVWERRGKDFRNRQWGALDSGAQRALAGQRWARTRAFGEFGNTAVYPPLLYGPALVGWRLGEAADWTIFQSLHLARLLNVVMAVLLVWGAMRVCAIPAWFLLPTVLLPSAVFLYASSSQDALLVPVAALAAALLTRPLAGEREFTRGEFWAIVLLLAVCGMAKPPYAGLALALFLPAVERGGPGWGRALGGFAAVVGTGAAWWGLVRHLGVESANEADPALQRLFLREHPVAAAGAVLRGTWEVGGDFVHRGLYVIGWNDLLAPQGLMVAAWVCVGLLVLVAPQVRVRSWRGFVVLGSAVLAPLLGISLAEYVIWTPVGLGTVYGVQPRYWLPVMPLATLLMGASLRPVWQFVRQESVRGWLVRGAACGLAGVLCTLPWVAAHAFYGMSVADVVRLNLR